MSMLRRMLCIVAVMMICTVQALAATNHPAVTGDMNTPSPTVRIYLKRLNLTDRADLTLDGVYMAKASTGTEIGFPRGSSTVIQLRNERLYLYYGGAAIDMGSSVTLTRMDAGSPDQDGIRFASGGNLYPGDLTLTISGSVLFPILKVGLQTYLQGVVPYEMSNDFPLEALKTQAVCARSYALSHVNKDRNWDMTDTTADQVYHGTNENYTRAIQAVRETAGIIGTYKGKVMSCYYSASNGGQTDLPKNVWGSSNTVYAMTDDPYDVQNPESITRTAKLNRNGSGLPSAFVQLLQAALSEQIEKLGFDLSPENFMITGVEQITLKSGLPAPSRYMKSMTITFTWSGRKWMKTTSGTGEDFSILTLITDDEPTPAEQTDTDDSGEHLTGFIAAPTSSTVTLQLFPETAKALGLNIPDTTYPLITLEETNTSFVLKCRRYGHGVGMSQRGAQWMAARYGKTFQQILTFYYPGMKLSTVSAGNINGPKPSSQLFSTPGPAASATPRPTLMPVTPGMHNEPGSYLASVQKIDDDSSLNLRAEPSGAGQILMRLYKHQQLVVLEELEEGNWAHVKTDVIEGYVMLRYLEKVSE